MRSMILPPACCSRSVLKMDASLKRKERGFECGFIEEPPTKVIQLECPLCLQILREPYQAPCCGKSFCQVCIEKAKTDNKRCPTCNCDFHQSRSSTCSIPPLTWDDHLSGTEIDMSDPDLSELFQTDAPSIYELITRHPTELALRFLIFYVPNKAKALSIIEALSGPTVLATKRMRIQANIPTPSTLGNLSDSDKYHKNVRTYHIYNHRPSHDLHVGLQVEAFAKFIGDSDFQVGQVLPNQYLDYALEVMRSFGEVIDENKKQEGLTTTLCKMFPSYNVGPKSWGSEANSKSDICISKNDQLLVCFECKKELSSSGAEPNVKNVGNFVKFTRANTISRSPMLLVSVVGLHYLQVFGATWNSDNVCVDPLCSPVSILYLPSDPTNAVVKLATVLQALVVAVEQLTQIPSDPKSGPYLDSIGGHQLIGMKKMGSYNHHTYEATWNNQEVVVKFSLSRYGFDVHQFLADLELAPKILQNAELVGKWQVVVMEKIGEPLPRSPNLSLKASLQKVLDSLKSKNFVHGDLQRQNIRTVDNKTVRIIDFDWAGVEGQVFYPPDINDKVEWHPEVERGGAILHTHDEFAIQQIFS